MKFILLILVSVALVGCSGGRNSTGYSIINDMMYSDAYEAFSDNSVFEDGQTMQPAPENTIPRGYMPEETGDDGKLIVVDNPYKNEMTEYDWKRGKLLFEKTCSACHGVKGAGDGLVVTKGGFPAPTKFTTRKWRKKGDDGNFNLPSGYVYNVITEGYGNMKSHAQQLYQRDRWLVSEYVREYLMRGGSNYKKELK